ncbi:MAG: 30S ribosomal protein S1, partial [Prevotella sp.]|nr:30S ribosomal protein S1 [Prevotella sp.]
DKGAVISLPYGVEGFATPKHLVKEDGSQAQIDEKLQFKVIEFNKDSKRIIVSHSKVFEDEKAGEAKTGATTEKKPRRTKKEKTEEPAQTTIAPAEKTTLGDIEELAALKEKLSGEENNQ